MWLAASAAFAVCLIARPDICASSVKSSLELCIRTLIPSIFPFLVVNSILSGAGGIELAAGLVGKPFSALFGVSGNLCAPFLIGLISGFPSGGSAVAEVYSRGGCTKEEAERSLAFCSNTGPAFAVAGIGGMLGSVRYGLAIFAVQIICAFLCAFILPGRGASRKAMIDLPRKRRGNLFVSAVGGAVIPMLNICAFVLIFSPLTALLRALLCRLGASLGVTAVLLSFIEITGACDFISSFLPMSLALPLCSLAVCWSGICVHTQTLSAVAESGLSMKYCIVGKLFMGSCAFLIMWLVCPYII